MYNQYIPAEEPGAAPSNTGRQSGPNRQTGTGGLGGMLRHLLEGGIPKPERLLQLLHLDRFDHGDLLLLLILVYLFLESDDEDWLIVLALVVLMGL